MKKLLYVLVVCLLAACGGNGEEQLNHTSKEVADILTTTGLEVENATEMTATDYGLAPMLGEGTRFTIPSLGEDKGGRIIVTENATDAKTLSDYYTNLGEQSALFFSWVFTRDNVVIQVNGELPKEQALLYKDALDNMK